MDGRVGEHRTGGVVWVGEQLQLVLELLEVGVLLSDVVRFLQEGGEVYILKVVVGKVAGLLIAIFGVGKVGRGVLIATPTLATKHRIGRGHRWRDQWILRLHGFSLLPKRRIGTKIGCQGLR
jgi:hypothetical protein